MPGNNVTEEELSKMSPEEIAELQKQNCIFCKIANKEIPAKIIHEDADTICILDINPASEGHILVYPKKHYMIMPHMPEDILQKVFKNVKLMSHTLLKSLQCKGTTIFIANGVAAGQKAPHVLVHVFPRRENDGLVNLPSYEISDEQLEKLKSDLERYISQIFGRKRPIIKNAEFSEKPKELPKIQERTSAKDLEETNDDKTDNDTDDEQSTESDDSMQEISGDDDTNRDDTEDEDEEETKPKKTSPKKKDTTTNVTAKKADNSKIDLDDISRLFG